MRLDSIPESYPSVTIEDTLTLTPARFITPLSLVGSNLILYSGLIHAIQGDYETATVLTQAGVGAVAMSIAAPHLDTFLTNRRIRRSLRTAEINPHEYTLPAPAPEHG